MGVFPQRLVARHQNSVVVAGGGDNHLIRRIAVERLRQLAGLDEDFGRQLRNVEPRRSACRLEPLAKWTLDAVMILGRLEIFSVIVVFSSGFWKR